MLAQDVVEPDVHVAAFLSDANFLRMADDIRSNAHGVAQDFQSVEHGLPHSFLATGTIADGEQSIT